ncbi:MAG: hypothetical protein MUO23_15190 [Anaerolineales bacterium]|nr:hypothetical protein [Anaerolineales bacterium]
MKSHSVQIAGVVVFLALAALACGGSITTANISGAVLSPDASGSPETSVFAPDQQTIYLLVELANAPEDTSVKAVWTAVEAEGVEPNFQIDETSLTSGDGTLTFELSNDLQWPTGSYKVDLYLNDKLDRTLPYEVR